MEFDFALDKSYCDGTDVSVTKPSLQVIQATKFLLQVIQMRGINSGHIYFEGKCHRVVRDCVELLSNFLSKWYMP